MLVNQGETMQDELKAGFKSDHFDESYNRYIVKNYYKTGALFSNAFKGLGEIFNLDNEMLKQLFDLGAQVGILFQLYDDYLDLVKTSESDKESYKDIRDSIVSLHFYVAYRYLRQTKGEHEASRFSNLYLKVDKSETDIENIKETLLSDSVNLDAQKILHSYYRLALEHLERLFKADTGIEGSREYFVNLIEYVINRHK